MQHKLLSMKKVSGISTTPVNVDDSNNDKAKELVPDSDYNILNWIINGDEKDGDLLADKNDKDTRVLSLAQDLIFAASNGQGTCWACYDSYT